MGQTNVWMDLFKLHDDLQTKYIEDLMLVYIFLSITLREGGKFTINRAKHLFRLIKLQPGKYLFRLLAESSFFVHTPSV